MSYSCIGNFIYSNYKQALDILQYDGATFALLAEKLKITSEDCERYLQEERKYLEKRKCEPPKVANMLAYAKALANLERYGYVSVLFSGILSHMS